MTRTIGDAKPFDTVSDELSLRLCELLKIDPGQTTGISLEVEPDLGAVVRWTGVQTVSLEDVGRVLTRLPAGSVAVADPWGDDDAGPPFT